jgi:hypothetical protein
MKLLEVTKDDITDQEKSLWYHRPNFLVGVMLCVWGNCCSLKISSGIYKKVKRKSKATPITGGGGPKGCEKSRIPHFLDDQLTDAVKLSALCAGCTLLPGRFLVLISVRG